ncbi:hypothetical protein AB1Y20_019322 [Prymnesium parvum]|uniref:Metaxin n=1 Tax=Prymnesium parvum TaxID=97485 RepID=A0AB34JU28_PRYPA
MHRLLVHGTVDELERAWRNGCPVDAVDERGRRALYLAAAAGEVEVVEWLLRHNASVSAVNAEDERTALHAACASGHSEVVQMLIDSKQDIDFAARDCFGLSAPELAASGRHLNVLRLLLSHHSPVLNSWLNKAAHASTITTPLRVQPPSCSSRMQLEQEDEPRESGFERSMHAQRPRSRGETAVESAMRLLQFSSAWGAPSLDAECTRAQAWLRICGLTPGVDYTVEDCNNPQVAVGGRLPVVELGPKLVEPSELYAALRSCGHDADSSLSDSQRADTTAYTALVTEQLGVALLYSWWVEAENYEVIRSAYAGRLPIPLCYYLPWSIRRKVHSQLARRSCIEEELAYVRGEDALRALSSRYGEKPYFYGNHPTGIDATVFGYLTAVYRSPLPKDRLRVAMRSYPNLVQLCERMSTRFFDSSAPLVQPEAPQAPLPPMSGKAIGEAEMEATSNKSSKSNRTPKAQRFKQRSRNALIAAGASALVYVFATDMAGSWQQQGDAEEEES